MRNALLVGLILLSCLSIAPGAELLSNPDFESGPQQGVPDGWSIYGGGVPESQLSISPEAHSGSRAVRLLDTGPNERDGRWSVGVYQSVPVTPERLYLASIWAKCFARNHDHALNLQLTFQPSGKTVVTRVTPQIGGEWRKFTVLGTAPPGDTSVILYIYTMHFWTGDFLVDEASLTEVSREVYGNRIALAQYGGLGIEAVRPLRLNTAITHAGTACAVLCVPKGEDWWELARHLQDEVKRRAGADLPITTDGKSLMDTEQTIIAIGNLNNNFIIERLHWNKYLVADSLTPGPENWVVRTVHQPFNFAPTVNVITVECSDLTGGRAGVEALLRLLPTQGDIVLPGPVMLTSVYQPMSEEQAADLLAEPLSRDPWVDFWRNAELYRDRGDLAYAKKAKQVLLQIGEIYQRDPGYAVTWPEETSSNRVGAAWDILEESPVFSDAERLQASNILLTLCYSLPRHVSGWGEQATNDTITWNHTTFPILGIYWLARHFQRWYGDVDGKIDEMMAEVRGCFRGQKKSWKPQCDADSYLTIVPNHLMEYTLAENDYEWFQNGNCRRYAEYLTAISDNQGYLPGFGDSGYSRAAWLELQGLPMALWYYRDGRYLWRLQQITRGKWQNPYDPTVKPLKWYSMAGLRVTRLHPENYNFTATRSYYGEPVEPPNVPFEKAFDKITFRQNLEPTGEFLLLDGYARGKHLHYDGNAIIKYSAGGEDWLIDGDYLVRNTTEHNMVSVIRDGRCPTLIPVCTALEHYADFDKAAFTHTQVRDYNGVNWSRFIAWLKGECFVVIDECEATVDGEYGLETVWKTLDRGTQVLEEGRVFRTEVLASGGSGSRGLTLVRQPQPDVPTAVRFTDQQSQLEFGLNLPAGSYEVTLFAYGLDTGTDSFWLTVDDGEPVAFHIPVKQFGPSSSSYTKDTPTPNVEIAGDGLHRFRITLREAPGVLLDRVLIRNAVGDVVADFQAEDAPSLPPDPAAPPPRKARFFLKSDGTARTTMTTWVNAVGLHIRKVHQKFGRRLAAGERASVMNVFYADTSDAPKDYDIRRLGPGAALLLKEGKPFAVLATDMRALGLPPDLTTDAAMLMVAGSRFYAVDATRLGVNGPRTDAPVSVALDLDLGYGTVEAHRSTRVHLPDGMEADIWQGGMTFDVSMVADRGLLALVKALPAALAGRAQAPSPPPTTRQEPLGLRIAWQLEPVEDMGEPQPVYALVAADLNGDGQEELIALRGRVATCLDAAGAPLWSFEAEAALQAAAVGDLNSDGDPEIIVGGDDERIHILTSRGAYISSCRVTTPLRVGTSSVAQPRVASLCVGDLEQDGKPDILVGTRNGNIARYDADLNLIWAFDQVEHGTREMALVDLDGDGKLEVVAGNRYGAVEVLSADGHARPGIYSELGDVEMAIGDLNGDGAPEVANGSSTGAFRCQTYGGPILFEFPNYGYGAKDVQMVKFQDGAPPLVAIASETGFVYVLDASGNLIAQKDLGEPVVALAPWPGATGLPLMAGCRDGAVYGLAADMAIVKRFACDWPIQHMLWIRIPGQQPRLVVAGEGRLTALDPE